MLFSYEQLLTLNRWLTGFWRVIWLNILWTATTVLGLGVLGVGPASYALARYLDRWFRLGETPPTTRTFLRYAREQGLRPVLTGAVLVGLGVVVGVNLLSITDWYLRAANLLAAVLVAVVGVYVFFVMAATDVVGIGRQLTTALLLSIGSLHWTVLGATAVVAVELLMLRHALALVPLLGAALPFVVVALVLRPVLRDLATPSDPDRRPGASAARPAPLWDRATPR
ncbi:DUF624 domain-containing protein [Desertihabitans aurantiacus]|uniref:DUF624 domain-containing protein n=1 Tax=Desertihabitans aurantiacus TaxID=2282477 RepID=UPI000DF72D03|nr:DUF624 domain-containing protein [Desertihabitans aurantiacus]